MTHQKRLSAPKHYPLKGKKKAYVSTIKGSRSREEAIPAVLFLREITEYADTEKEAKEIIRDGKLLRNGEPVRDIQDGIGVLDAVTLEDAEETYRVLIQEDSLRFVSTDYERKIAKIKDKEDRGDEYVYRLHNGENYRSEADHGTGNTLVFGDEVEELELEEGSQVLVIGGKHAGETGEVEEVTGRGVNPDTATLKEEDQQFDTQLENLVAVNGLEVE
ncbi:MAG: KOW motif-containing protein [Candidatus Nanohaloarchaea archaeon]